MMNVIEGNKLIAEFMGWELTTMNWRENYRHFELSIKYGEECYTNNDGKFAKSNGLSFKYHTSWDWLMPVVEKIETTWYRFTISSTFVRVHTCKKSWDDVDEYNVAAFDGKLNATWFAVVEFIKWYNSQSK